MKINFTLLCLALLFISTSVSAKKIYSGYIVTHQGEKIEGHVYFKSMTSNELRVKFRTNNKTKTYKAKQLQGYGFEMKKYNHTTKSYENVSITYARKQVEDAPIRFGSKDILIQQKINGIIKVYSQYIEADKKIGGDLKHFFYVEKANDFLKITKANYKTIMKTVVADFPTLEAKIGTRGYGYKHITKIAKMYNARFLEQNEPLITMQD